MLYCNVRMLWFAKNFVFRCYDFLLTDSLTRNYDVVLCSGAFSPIAQEFANIHKKEGDYFIENLS